MSVINKILTVLLFTTISICGYSQEQHLAELIPAGGGTFALMDAKYLRDGYRSVTRITERDSITTDRRKYGMLVYVKNTDSVYQLKSTALSNDNWVAFKLGSSSNLLNSDNNWTGNNSYPYISLRNFYDTTVAVKLGYINNSSSSGNNAVAYLPSIVNRGLLGTVDTVAYRSWVRDSFNNGNVFDTSKNYTITGNWLFKTPLIVKGNNQQFQIYDNNNTKRVVIGATASGTSSMYLSDQSGIATTQLNSDGSIIAGNLTLTNSNLYDDGSARFKDTVTAAAIVADRLHSKTYPYGIDLAGGSGYFQNVLQSAQVFPQNQLGLPDTVIEGFIGTNSIAMHNNIPYYYTGSNQIWHPFYTGGSYSAGYGLNLTGTTFKVDSNVIMPKIDSNYLFITPTYFNANKGSGSITGNSPTISSSTVPLTYWNGTNHIGYTSAAVIDTVTGNITGTGAIKSSKGLLDSTSNVGIVTPTKSSLKLNNSNFIDSLTGRNATLLGNTKTGSGSTIVLSGSPTLTLPNISAINVLGGILSFPTGGNGTVALRGDTGTYFYPYSSNPKGYGTGTISRVTAGTNMTGGGTSGTVTLNADTTTGATKLATQGYVLRNAGGGGGTPTLVSITKSIIDDSILANKLIAGTFYLISGVNNSLYGGTDIILQATSTNALSLIGEGKFYNPKYTQSIAGYGIWNNLSTWATALTSGTFQPNETVTGDNGATAQLFSNLDANEFINLGTVDWTAASNITGNSSGATANISSVTLKTYAIGDKAIWGGKVWTNTTGNVGSSTDVMNLDGTNWTVVAYNTTDYNVVWDDIQYDYSNDLIVYRKDKANNVVSTSEGNEKYNNDNYSGYPTIALFQWGNDYDYYYSGKGVGNNIVDGSYVESVNFCGYTFIYNSFTQNSSYQGNSTDFSSYFNNNTLSSLSSFSTNTISSSSGFNNNTLSSSSSFYNNTLSSSSFSTNTLSSSYFSTNTLSGSYFGNNTLSNSSFNDNTLNSSYFGNNTLSSSSSFSTNTLSGSSFNNNTLSSSSGFNNNTLSSSSFYNNTLSNSYFGNNTLSSSYFSNNTLSSSTLQNCFLNDGTNYIRYNSLLSSSSIDGVVMQGGSTIENNTLTEQSSYNGVTISGGSVFKWNKIQLNFTYNTTPQTTDITKHIFQ